MSQTRLEHMTEFERKQWAKIIKNAKQKAKKNETTKDRRKQKRTEATEQGTRLR
jgi:hypothetical protein